MSQCTVNDCNRPLRPGGKVYCEMHYMRQRRHGGDPYYKPPAREPHRDSSGYVIEGNRDPLVRWESEASTRQHRAVLFEKIGPGEHACHWCGLPVSWDKSYPKDSDGLVVDHVDGIRWNNDSSNLVPYHNSCNTRRAFKGRRRGKNMEWL